MKVYIKYQPEKKNYEIFGVYNGKQYILETEVVKAGKLHLCAEIINANTKPITFDFVNITHVKRL